MNAKCQCECGVVYSYGNRLRHFNSKHHKNFLNNNIDKCLATRRRTTIRKTTEATFIQQ